MVTLTNITLLLMAVQEDREETVGTVDLQLTGGMEELAAMVRFAVVSLAQAEMEVLGAGVARGGLVAQGELVVTAGLEERSQYHFLQAVREQQLLTREDW